jgi:phenylacetate-CoA ligase
MGLARLVAPWFLRRAGQSDYLRFLREAESNQWKSPAEIRDIRWQKFLRLLDHAVREVPYYQKTFRGHGLDVSHIHSLDDVPRIPLLTKTHIQQNLDSLLARGADKGTLVQKSSSGSTGTPTTVYLDSERGLRSWAWNTRHNRWAGLDWGSKVGSMWGQPSAAQPSAQRARSWWQRQMDATGRTLSGQTRELYLNPYGYSAAEMDRFAHNLVAFQPDILLGYSNTLHALAWHVQENRIAGIRPRGIIPGGEVLTPEVRTLLESVFGCKVFMRYGTREVDIIASECEHGGLHLNNDHLLVELVPETDTGAARVVVTDLHNFAMPLIRYDLEDLATPGAESCPCGRRLSLLGSIVGRTAEVFRSRSGYSVGGLWFSSQLRLIPGVTTYQVHQTGYEDFRIRVVASRKLTESDFQPLLSGIREKFGRDTRIQLEQVPDIKKTGTGKFRFLICDVR